MKSERNQDMREKRKELICQLMEDECYVPMKEKELAAHKKKLGQVDSRYLKIAERLVCEEFAVALNTGPESIRRRVYAAMEREAPKL